ncbi:MAG: NACHT domain-containing protein, partial [Anaerolineae bacterium]
MRQIILLFTCLFLAALTRLTPIASAQTPTPPPTLPATTSTPAPMMVVVTPTPATPPEPGLPFGLDKTLMPALDALAAFGLWRTLGFLILAAFIGLGIKFWKEISDRAVKYAADWTETGGKGLASRWRRKPDPHRQALLKDTLDRCAHLELKGFVREHVTIVSLNSLYVPLFAPPQRAPGHLGRGGEPGLLVASGQGGSEKPVPLTQLFGRHRCLVLVGEAGSGKTTVMRYVALNLAQALRQGRPHLARNRLGWDPLPDRLPLPLFVPLSGFGLYLSGLDEADKPEPDARFLLDYLQARRFAGLNLPPDYLETRLQQGDCLLLLDGLDEVARFPDRRFISETVTLFSKRFEQSGLAVTCRPEGYQGAAQLGGDFQRYNVERLSWPEDVTRFIRRWNRGVLGSRASAEANAADFLRRLADAPQVQELANNPLLLTVMVIVHYNVGLLPERRADLYDHCTELLLGWDARWGRVLAAPPPWLDERPAKERRLPLEELAFHWQEDNAQEAHRPAAELTLTPYFLTGRGQTPQRDAQERASQYLDWVVQRSYLLRELGDTLSFYRRAFQEYLAARRLARDPKLIEERLGQVLPLDWWEETLLLAVGHLSNADPDRARALLAAMIDTPDRAGAPHRHLTLAARALLDAAPGFQSESWELRETLGAGLAAALRSGGATFTPAARLAAGDALGALGDPRDLDEMVHIPAGPFPMGSTPEE